MNIYIKNLNYSYFENTIFNSLNLKFEEKKFYGILGSNGCGKTTLIKTILKLLKIENDSILYDNEDLNSLKREDIAKKIAYVEQSTQLVPQISVFEYIRLSRYLFNDSLESETLKVNKVINQLKINKLRNKYLNELSGGELQKVIIARAIAQESKILILDEPIANLDPLHQLEIMTLLKDLVLKNNLTIITTLHDINLSLSFCDEIVLLDKEKRVQGKVNDVITQSNIKEFFNLDSHFITNPYTKKPYVILNH